MPSSASSPRPRPRPTEVGEFLKASRARLTPSEVGLSEPAGRRKVAGLRREEVAQLAAISVDYYTRLEQGRVQPSAGVLASLVQALRLDEDQHTYLYELAGKSDARPARRPRREQPRPPVLRLLDQLTETPAVVLGRRMDVLAWNPAAAALYIDFGRVPVRERNYVRLLFTDPVLRALHVQWEHDARSAVAALRMQAAQDLHDPELAALVGQLSLQDAQFRKWWASRAVSGAGHGTKHYHHRVVGALTLDCDTWSSPDGSGQRLMVLTAEPGTPSQDALRILTSYAADPAEADSDHDPDSGYDPDHDQSGRGGSLFDHVGDG